MEHIIDRNQQFNDELQQQIEGVLTKNHTYRIGPPSAILQSAGIPDLPIEMRASRLSDKSMQENHPFNLLEIQNLPNAIQNPFAVFRSATHIGSYVILTEIEHQGRNFVVALQANKQKGKIEVNDIRSVHYRNSNTHIANWINENLLEYVDKKKLTDWINKQRYNSAEVANTVGKLTEVKNLFNRATKVIQNFQNPKIKINEIMENEVFENSKIIESTRDIDWENVDRKSTREMDWEEHQLTFDDVLSNDDFNFQNPKINEIMGDELLETKRLEILKKSLEQKEELFNKKLQGHFDTVKQANGQPLNDKRNGQATLNKWERQHNSLRRLQESIEKTQKAIEKEEWKISNVQDSKAYLPNEILERIKSGELIQWRKHPNTFFVEGVDKARIVWDNKKKIIAHRYSNAITDKEQHRKFARIYNTLSTALNSNIKHNNKDKIVNQQNNIDMEQKNNSEKKETVKKDKTVAETLLGVTVDERKSLIDNAYTNFMKQYRREPRIPKATFEKLWTDFEKLGLTMGKLQKAGVTNELIDGKTTLKNVPISVDVAGSKVESEGKLAIHQDVEGNAKLKLYPMKQEANLKEYFGHTFTEEERDNILKTGSPGNVVYAQFGKDQEKVPVLLTLDKDTNHFFAQQQKYVKIPEKFFGATLTDEQKEQLLAGKKVFVEKMQSMSSPEAKPFSANVQYNAVRKGLELMFEQEQKQRLAPPKKIANYELTSEQRETLQAGKAIFAEGLTDKAGKVYNAYILWNKETGKLNFSGKPPVEELAKTTIEKVPTPEHKTQVAANNDGHKPEALKDVQGPVKQKQPNVKTDKQVTNAKAVKEEKQPKQTVTKSRGQKM